jgi:hypothetical protein
VLRTVDAGNSLTRVRTIDGACRMYKQKFVFYPGQQYLVSGSFTDPVATWATTGSQQLSVRLLWMGDGDAPGSSSFLAYSSDLVDIGGAKTNKRNAVLDTFAKPKAILYFVSKYKTAGQSTGTQYQVGQNSGLITASQSSFEGRINDPRYGGGGRPYKDGEFILIGAGADREYLTEDDASNFSF